MGRERCSGGASRQDSRELVLNTRGFFSRPERGVRSTLLHICKKRGTRYEHFIRFPVRRRSRREGTSRRAARRPRESRYPLASWARTRKRHDDVRTRSCAVTRTRTHFFSSGPFSLETPTWRRGYRARPRRPRSVSSTWRPEAEPRRSSARDEATPRASRPPPVASTSTARWTSAPRLAAFPQTPSRGPQREAARPRATTDPTSRATPAIPRIAKKYPGRGRPRRRRCVSVPPPSPRAAPETRSRMRDVRRTRSRPLMAAAAVIRPSALATIFVNARPLRICFLPAPKTPLDCPPRTNT